MDEINPDMPQVDVALVVGANDVVNPAARTDRTSPIFGMPIIAADKARAVFAIKRSKNPGFAGIDNELYFADRTWMLFGDAKHVIGANDVVNPAARYAKGSPIYGMPIVAADKARTVLAIKRSKNPGFAGIDNELYVLDNTWMLFGDAKGVIGDLVKQFAGGGLH